jgi:hypothetical protein
MANYQFLWLRLVAFILQSLPGHGPQHFVLRVFWSVRVATNNFLAHADFEAESSQNCLWKTGENLYQGLFRISRNGSYRKRDEICRDA